MQRVPVFENRKKVGRTRRFDVSLASHLRTTPLAVVVQGWRARPFGRWGQPQRQSALGMRPFGRLKESHGLASTGRG
jgi:hypothetical protein